jgi:hypothetical protein
MFALFNLGLQELLIIAVPGCLLIGALLLVFLLLGRKK